METAAVISAVITGFITLVGVFLKYINAAQKSQEKRDELFSNSLTKNTTAMQSVAKATQKQAKEAEKRNGHLAELAIENKESTLMAISMIKDNIQVQRTDNKTVKE